MAHKFDPARMGSLTSERRQEAVKPLELLQRAGVQAGETILDWGCGAGFFAVPAARLVGEAGQSSRSGCPAGDGGGDAKSCGQRQVWPILRSWPPKNINCRRGCPILTGLFWLIFFTKCTNPAGCMELAQKALKPDGRLLVVEWPQEIGPHGPPAAERLAPADLAAWYEPLGLQREAFWEAAPEYYALVLR